MMQKDAEFYDADISALFESGLLASPRPWIPIRSTACKPRSEAWRKGLSCPRLLHAGARHTGL